MLITTIARIPSVITSTLAGDKLIQQDFASAFWIYAITIAFSAAGMLVYRAVMKKRQQKAKELQIRKQNEAKKGKPALAPVKGIIMKVSVLIPAYNSEKRNLYLYSFFTGTNL